MVITGRGFTTGGIIAAMRLPSGKAPECWPIRQLDRQIGSQFYECIALSKNKAAMLEGAERAEASDVITAEEAVKDTFVLEFLGLNAGCNGMLPDALIELACRQVRSSGWIVGNPSVTRPNGQRRVRCGLPVIRECPEALWSALLGGILGRMWKTLALGIFAIVPAHDTYSQVPCPVSLTSANAEQDSIKLEFRNKGKIPIEQLSLSCTPSANNKSRSAICHNETGIFYPGNEYWIEIAYPGANRRTAVIAVKEVRMAGGAFWNTRSSDSCRTLRVPRKR